MSRASPIAPCDTRCTRQDASQALLGPSHDTPPTNR